MNVKFVLGVFCVAGAMALSAAPAGKADPVAEGYPVWQGFSPKGHISGREICPSDLRHKVTVVLEIEPNAALQSQLLKAGWMAALNGLSGFHPGVSWETMELPRNVIFVISNRGNRDHEGIMSAFKPEKDAPGGDVQTLAAMHHYSVPIYDGVTFAGAPDTTGKRPYVYVMGPKGTTPLWHGTLADAAKNARAAIDKGKKDLAGKKWLPFYGFVAEPQFYPQMSKTIEKGKPLAAFEKALLKDVVSSDAAKATEAQLLYDALNQTRSDLVLRIRLEAGECPHRAYYDYRELGKYWPSEKKQFADVLARIKTIPDAESLAKIFCRILELSDPSFVCKKASDAKKIVAELNKMKKAIEKMKESDVTIIQNGAAQLDSRLDALISEIPSRVPEK